MSFYFLFHFYSNQRSWSHFTTQPKWVNWHSGALVGRLKPLELREWLPWQGAYAVSLVNLNRNVFPPPLLVTSLILSSCFKISATKTKMQPGHPNNLHMPWEAWPGDLGDNGVSHWSWFGIVGLERWVRAGEEHQWHTLQCWKMPVEFLH